MGAINLWGPGNGPRKTAAVVLSGCKHVTKVVIKCEDTKQKRGAIKLAFRVSNYIEIRYYSSKGRVSPASHFQVSSKPLP